MKCAHCLCGDAQNVDIHNDYILALLKYIGEIKCLTFTGGEPSLNVPAIRFTFDLIRRRKIKVHRFHIVTNGSHSSIGSDFIEICRKLYDYQIKCGDDEEDLEDILFLSNDKYHDSTHHDEVNAVLSKLPFYAKRFSQNVPYKLIKQGRSKEGIELVDLKFTFCKGYVSGEIFLNAHGLILGMSNYSYDNHSKYQLCHVSKFEEYLKFIEIRTLY